MKNEKKARRSRRPPVVTEAPAIVEPQHLVARSIFGQVAEVHRPRLVLFVGAPDSSAAPVAALWFAMLAAESKATVVLAYPNGMPALLSAELFVALCEIGLDPRRLVARDLTPRLMAAADLVVTLSSGRQARPKLPPTARRREHWMIPGPNATVIAAPARTTAQAARPRRAGASKRDPLAAARELRDALRARVAMLVFSEGWGRPEISREDARVTRAHGDDSDVGVAPLDSPAGRPRPVTPSLAPEVTPAWFPQPSLSPPSLR